jgi:hypothetical protein
VRGGVQLGPLGSAATKRPIVPALGDYDDRAIGGMVGRGNRNTRRKPAPVPLCPSQTPHAAWTRNLAAAVGSQRLTAWATAWPHLLRVGSKSHNIFGYGYRPLWWHRKDLWINLQITWSRSIITTKYFNMSRVNSGNVEKTTDCGPWPIYFWYHNFKIAQ